MNNAITQWSRVTLGLLELAATWWLQATILLALGLFAAALLRRPVWQSLVFRVTIASVLFSPLLAKLLLLMGCPLITIDIHSRIFSHRVPTTSMPAWSDLKSNPGDATDATLHCTPTVDPFASQADRMRMNPPAAGQIPLETDGGKIGREPLVYGSSVPRQSVAVSAARQETRASQSIVGSPENQRFVYGSVTLVIWIFGTALLMTRLLFDLARSQSLRRQSGRADEQCEGACLRVARRLHLRQPPEVLVNPFLSSPCLIGHWRPTILLPEDIDPSNYDQVFLHELAHLHRGDWLWCAVGRIAQALLWCQPLIWWLHRKNLSVAEEICDDYVIQHGCNRESYLQQLIQIADRSLPQTHSIGVSMVGFRSKLGRRAIRIVDTTRALSTQAGKLFVAIAFLGTLVTTLGVALIEIGQSKLAVAGPQTAEAASSTTTSAKTDDEAVNNLADKAEIENRSANAERTYSGKVVDPNGKPLAGATVSAINKMFSRSENRWNHSKQLAVSTTAEDGSYALTFQPEDGNNQVVAELDGYAPDVVSFDKLNELFEQNNSHLDLRLAKSKLVTGRIVDTEGNAIAGVSIEVVEVVLPTSDEAVEKWIANANPALLKGRDDFVMMSHDPRVTETQFPGRSTMDGATVVDGKVETDSNGKFQLSDIGENYLVRVKLVGPRVALHDVLIVGRDMPSLQAFNRGVRDNDYTHYGASPTIVAYPTQLISGLVVDAESGEPLANTRAMISRVGKSNWRTGEISASTDQNGRFQLVGAPLGGNHRVSVQPELDQPYFETHLELPASSSSTPLECKFELPKTKWIVGRVTNEDGEPLEAFIQYFPFRNNEHAERFSNFDQRITGRAPDNDIKSGPDGRFRIRAIAGPAVLAACISDNAEQPKYIPNRSEDLLQRIGGEQMGKLFDSWSADYFDAMVEVDIEPATEEITQDLAFKKGRVRALDVVDENGEAIQTISALGTTFPPRYRRDHKLGQSKVEIIGLQPSETRLVVLMTADGRSGKMFSVSGSGSEPVDVQLQKCATVSGQVLDEEAQPVANLQVHISPVQEPSQDNWSRELGPVATDAKGQFQIHLAAGGLYRLWAYTSMGPNFQLSIRPEVGATYQLGKLTNGMELTEAKSAKLLQTTEQ